jgi:hypothetical protein
MKRVTHTATATISVSHQPALDNRLSDPDGFYEALLDAHADLKPEQSVAYNARLILILANQIGDTKLLQRCIELAKL